MSDSPLIRTVQLSKSYRLKHGVVLALRAVDLTVDRGESVALMGPSGSGKSTLLHLLGCLDSPSAGQYWLEGQEVSGLSDAMRSLLRASRIGFVFQSFHLIPQLNVFENVELPFFYSAHTLAPLQIRQRVLEALERVGLGHRLYHVPAELSGGEIQRVAIARALVGRPLLLLADEPTGNLDRETGKAILQLFGELNVQGTTLLLSTHDPQAAAHCQRTVHLLDGFTAVS